MRIQRGLSFTGFLIALAALVAVSSARAETTLNASAEFTTVEAIQAQGFDPFNCSGYPEERVFLESQAWWSRPGLEPGRASRHSHFATCWPHGQTVSGDLVLHVRLLLHNLNDGSVAYRMRFHLIDAGIPSELGSAVGHLTMNWVPTDENEIRWVEVHINTSAASSDGRKEFRGSLFVERPDGAEMFQSHGWQVYLENGKSSSSDYRSSDEMIARGWYEGTKYTNASLKSPDATQAAYERICGVWSPRVRLDRGSGGTPVTSHSAHVDPNFHHDNAGLIVKEGSGPYSGSITIDTRALSAGTHKLVLKADSEISTGTNTGVLVVPFVVGDSFTPDAALPSVEITSPTSGAAVSGLTTIQTDVDDDVCVEHVDFYVDGVVQGTDLSWPFEFSWDTTGLSEGTEYVLRATAYDLAGNSRSSAEVVVTAVNLSGTGINPVPTLTSISPSRAMAGGGDFALTVMGSDFVLGSVVGWNASDRTTTFVDSGELQASIPASDIAVGGTAEITVFNPAPGGGPSGSVAFSIILPPPPSFPKNPGSPAVNPGGTVNGASFAPGAAVAPGSIISLFGIDLATSTAIAESLPLPTTLAGVTVEVNGIAAPLFFVSPLQINFQLPNQLEGQSEATLTVSVHGATGSPQMVSLSSFGPGLFATNAAGSGQGAILIAATSEVAAPSGSIPGRAARPVNHGEFISIFCGGLGDVTNRPASGEAASSDPLSTTITNPTVTIGGIQGAVNFSGLAPGFVGLYQVNVEVPEGVEPGSEVLLVLLQNGVPSNTVTIAVQ